MMIPGIFLAAGEGKRFGSDKLLTLLDDEPIIVKSLKASIGSSLEEIIVVLGHESEKIKRVIEAYFRDCRKLKFIVNPDYREGMISSLNSGLSDLGDVSGAMMILGDMPYVRSDTIDKLIRSWNGKDFLVPEVNGNLTHPRIIPSSLFEDFIESDLLSSGKKILKKNLIKLKTVLFRNGDQFRDIDLKSDLPS